MINIVPVAENPVLLDNRLFPMQQKILQDFWRPNITTGVWVLGRRSGKTLCAAISAIYAGIVQAPIYKQFLRKHEKFYIIVVANKEKQACIALEGIKKLLMYSPTFSKLIVSQTSTEIELSTGAVFVAVPCSARSVRGLASPFVIMDEAAHFTDTELGNAAGDSLYQAVSPSVAQFGDYGRILIMSSPWIQAGIFWKLYQDSISGEYPSMQCAQYPTWEVNPSISQRYYDEQRSKDPLRFNIEFGAKFSDALQGFIPNYLITAAINYDRNILLPQKKYRGNYFLALDPAKGGRDDYTACIGHYEGDRLVIDLWHEFKPRWVGDSKVKEVIVEEVEDWIIDRHREYGFKRVVLDQYNSQATIQRLRPLLSIEELTWTQTTKTEAYSEMKQLFNSQRIELYLDAKAINQLRSLIVIYRSSGNWSVTGGDGVAVDDYVSALAGVIYLAKPKSKSMWEVEI